jgi:uncharacterized protein (TIGR02646 family)
MIHVERGPAPDEYLRRMHKALQEQRMFHERHPDTTVYQRHRLSVDLAKSTKPLLLKRFHGKCAYCESLLTTTGHADLENFRPKSRYWWLTADWNNLLIACQVCNRAKADRFPLLDESKRAKQEGDERFEQPLLLNPCEDQPVEHLVFSDEGQVFSDTQRGQVTIDTLQLNRPPLVEERRGIKIDRWIAIAKSYKNLDPLLDLVEDESPYAGAARQMLARALQRLRRTPRTAKWIAQLEGKVRSFPEIFGFQRRNLQAAQSAYEVHEDEVENFALPAAGMNAISERYFAKRRTVNRIQIRNFKAIRDLDISLATSPSDATSWLMLLGENATGKSSILKAIALALMNEEGRAESKLRPGDVLTHKEKDGHVRVWLTGVSAPAELTYRIHDERFGGTSAQKVLLLGYGSTRLLPPVGAEAPALQEFHRVSNLFDPFAPLINAEAWVVKQVEPLMGLAKGVIKELLVPLRKKDSVIGEQSSSLEARAYLNMFDDLISFAELSDGYRSILALAVDVLSVLLPVWKERIEMAEGIVLIDEIDAHLHPTWRMQVVSTLRRCFPNVQFITTTHDPLCLKGLHSGEVVVLRRNRNGRIRALEDLPSPEGMSVDQLLTSEHFGLGSTLEPHVEQTFRHYYGLLARKKRSPAQERRLKELKQELAQLHHMGRTRREQLMLEVIDAYLVEDTPANRETQQQRRKQMLEQLVQQWTRKGA